MDAMLQPWHLWIILGVCLFIGEVFVSSFLLAGLGFGCLMAGVVHWFAGDLTFAMAAFITWSITFLALIRPYLSKALGPEQVSYFGADGMIGDVVQVSDASDVGGQLKARYRDTTWTLRCDQDLFEGDKAQIIGVDGSILVVAPLRED